MTGKQKASVLLHLLGSDVSSAILQELPENMAAYVTAGFIGKPSPEQISQVLHDLRSLPAGNNSNASIVDESAMKKVPDEAELNTLVGLAKHYQQRFLDILKLERKQLQILFLARLPEDIQQDYVQQLFGTQDLEMPKELPFMTKIYPELEKKLILKVKGNE